MSRGCGLFALDRLTHDALPTRAHGARAEEDRAMTTDEVMGEMIEIFGSIGIDGVLEHVADACEVEADAAEGEADAVTWQALAEHFRGKAEEVGRLHKENAARAQKDGRAVLPTAGRPVAWREFTEIDWGAYAGAVRFSDGRDPMIATIRVDGREADAVLHGDGLHIGWWMADETDRLARIPPQFAARAAVRLTTEMTADGLRGLGATIR
jgi:hypothetical protein